MQSSGGLGPRQAGTAPGHRNADGHPAPQARPTGWPTHLEVPIGVVDVCAIERPDITSIAVEMSHRGKVIDTPEELASGYRFQLSLGP